ncbi:hypothetical protein M3J09_013743 [Ascochyta lentis]
MSCRAVGRRSLSFWGAYVLVSLHLSRCVFVTHGTELAHRRL